MVKGRGHITNYFAAGDTIVGAYPSVCVGELIDEAGGIGD